jgi:hypothetical protein
MTLTFHTDDERSLTIAALRRFARAHNEAAAAPDAPHAAYNLRAAFVLDKLVQRLMATTGTNDDFFDRFAK